MGKLSFIVLTLLFFASLAQGAEQGSHLFILSGQSNMEGLDPEISFTPTVTEEFGKERVIIVKDAANGQPIYRWYKEWKPAHGAEPKGTGDLYDRLIKKVNTAIQSRQIATITFIWMQGETDAKKDGAVYAKSLKGLRDQLERSLGRNDINFVIGRITDYRNEERFPDWEMVRKAQVEVAEANPHGAWVNTDDLNDGKLNSNGRVIKNGVHFSEDGYRLLGQRFAEKAIALIKNRSSAELLMSEKSSR